MTKQWSYKPLVMVPAPTVLAGIAFSIGHTFSCGSDLMLDCQGMSTLFVRYSWEFLYGVIIFCVCNNFLTQCKMLVYSTLK